MEETSSAILKDGREICLEDDSDISLSIVCEGKRESVFPVPTPQRGYAGGTLLLSPSEKYLIFSYYSGQSEEAFMLFEITPTALELKLECGYFEGEAADYCFASDESFAVQALPATCADWWDYFDEFSQMDEDGEHYCKYGEINIFSIGTSAVSKHPIRVYQPDSLDEDCQEDYSPFMEPKIANGNSALSIEMPWGPEELELPLSGPVYFFKPQRA